MIARRHHRETVNPGDSHHVFRASALSTQVVIEKYGVNLISERIQTGTFTDMQEQSELTVVCFLADRTLDEFHFFARQDAALIPRLEWCERRRRDWNNRCGGVTRLRFRPANLLPDVPASLALCGWHRCLSRPCACMGDSV